MSGTCITLLMGLALGQQPPPPRAPFLPFQPDAGGGGLAHESEMVATWLAGVAQRVAEESTKPVKTNDLLAAGLAELYDSAGKKLPADVTKKLAANPGWVESIKVVAEARQALGSGDDVAGMRAFVTACNGFSKVLDPYAGLVWTQSASLATSDAEFGMGFELEGATSARWLAYLLEAHGALNGVTPQAGDPRPPVGAPWLVRRVIPGSPAARAGLRPGDVISHLDGTAVTAATNAKLFRKLLSPNGAANPDPFDGAARGTLSLKVRRPGTDRPLDVALDRGRYVPESIFGVSRADDGSWRHLLDRDAKIGYIRVGAMEQGAEHFFREAVGDLVRQGAAGLVLDLRWCPGGYVEPTVAVASVLLPAGKTIATVKSRTPNRGGRSEYTSDLAVDGERFTDLPVAVLVNVDTVGGGEMIAAALQDHGRGVIVGQRTHGKANLMNLVETPFGGLGFRVTTGYSFRPSGKPRHRHPDSKPTDDWGVRPDAGFEIPTTRDLSAKLKEQAERQAIRPAGDREAVAFDDPLADPQRMIAVKLLKEKIAKK